jgi:hypothetical protein
MIGPESHGNRKIKGKRGKEEKNNIRLGQNVDDGIPGGCKEEAW